MADLRELFEQAQANRKDEKIEYTQGETENFKKAFDDPEFRRMFTEYMDEMQDPNNRKVQGLIYNEKLHNLANREFLTEGMFVRFLTYAGNRRLH
jgi:hypothetical protein